MQALRPSYFVGGIKAFMFAPYRPALGEDVLTLIQTIQSLTLAKVGWSHNSAGSKIRISHCQGMTHVFT